MTTTLATRTIAPPVTDIVHAATTSADRNTSRLALLWGILFTLCITGYTFGQSNHHVYLLDAIRFGHPELLTRDWFVNNTLQYHYLFTLLTVGLSKLGLLKAGFFVLYLGLVGAMHVAWLSIVRSLGFAIQTYLLSVVLYHLSGGGLGLGVYQILQDGSFLPSNVAAVACLGAIAFWMRERLWGAALCVAIAGLFHVNYALACVAAWGGLSLLSLVQHRSLLPLTRWQSWAAAAVAVGPCLYTVLVAMRAADEKGATIPIADFFAVYVHLRHSHHHEPLAWPLALWISFLWPLPIAFLALWKLPKTRAVQIAAVILMAVLAVLLFAFVFAGVWYVSGTLVKLSLFRFSPFAKVLSCILAAWMLAERWRSGRFVDFAYSLIALGLFVTQLLVDPWPGSIPQPTFGLFALGGALMLWLSDFADGRPRMQPRWMWRIPQKALPILLLVLAPVVVASAARQQLGVAMPGEADAEMADVAAWAKANTATDALFLVPPHDQSFTLAAQRAEVVSFKHVPQLSKEIIEWKRRLDDVLDMNVATLPTPMPRTMAAMADRYAALPADHLRGLAAEYGCDYTITMAPLPNATPVHVSPAKRYWVYRADR